MCEGVSLNLTHPFCYIVCRQAFVSPSLRVAVTAYTLHCRCTQVAALLHAGCSVTAHRLQRYCTQVAALLHPCLQCDCTRLCSVTASPFAVKLHAGCSKLYTGCCRLQVLFLAGGLPLGRGRTTCLSWVYIGR